MYWYTAVFLAKDIGLSFGLYNVAQEPVCLRSGYKRQAVSSSETLMTTHMETKYYREKKAV
jgi:hypothetical protein